MLATLLETSAGEGEMGLFWNQRSDRNQLESDSAHVVAFLNQKGGVGKTTMAFNTAFALKERGERVLCIDMDPQGNLSMLFGLDFDQSSDSPHIHHLLLNSVRELKALHTPVLIGEVIQNVDGVDILPAGQELSGFDLTVAGINFARQLILKRFLETSGLLAQYDTIIIDGPPTLGLLVINVLCASQGVMVPFKPDDFSKKGLTHLYEVLADIEDMGLVRPPRVIAHIPNLVDSRRKLEGQDLIEIEKSFGSSQNGAPMSSVFYNRGTLLKAQSQRRSVFHYKSKEFKPLQDQFGELAGMIQGMNYGAEAGL